jgi:tetraacyldisaccharide 4'-kinase
MIQSPLLRSFLRPVAALYSATVSLRADLYKTGFLKKVKVAPRVISVGNLTVGGTGKTPFTMRVAELLCAQNQSVAVVCRGYKRSSGSTGSIHLASDGKEVSADVSLTGDEAQLLAQRMRGVFVVVGSPKWRAAQWVESHLPASWIVLDDGFQHLKLTRDRNILLLDAERPFDNGRVIPMGRLREPAKAMERADLVVLVGSSNFSLGASDRERWRALSPSAEVFSAHRECAGVSLFEGKGVRPVGELQGKKLVSFCGIAQPGQFLRDLRDHQLDIADSLVFPDHHRYRPSDTRDIILRALRCGAEALITTAKDTMNLTPRAFGNWPCFIFEIKMQIDDETRFLQALSN